MGKFFKIAKRGRSDPEVRRAISERALVKLISPHSTPDSSGFFTGNYVDAILNRNIKPYDKYDKTWLKNVDPDKVKNVARKYGDKLLDTNKNNPVKDYNFGDKEKLLEYVGANDLEKMLVLDSKFQDYLADFRSEIKKGWDMYKYQQRNKDVAER